MHSVALWKAALTLLTYVRPILTEYEYPVHFPPLNPSQSTPDASPSHRVDGARSPQATPPTYASKLIFDRGGTNAGLFVTAQSSRPVTPQVFRHPFARKRQNSGSVQSQSRHGSSPASSRMDVSPLKGAVRMDGAEPKIIGGLPVQAWSIILALLADPHGMLSDRQVKAIVTHGSNRRTLAMEADALGKPDPVQIWKVLEAVDCLIYDDQVYA